MSRDFLTVWSKGGNLYAILVRGIEDRTCPPEVEADVRPVGQPEIK